MVTNDLDGRPFQLKFVRAAQMMMFANVICDPPFGQVTVISPEQTTVDFTVLIESSISFPEQPWEVVLWHNCNKDKQWVGRQLEEVKEVGGPLAISSKSRPKAYRRYFQGNVPISIHKVEFTVKFKTSTSDSWKWVNDQSHLTNGMLLLQSYELPARLHDCFDEFTYAFTVEATSSEVPETKLWSLTLELPFAGSKSSFSNDLLGVPLDVSRWFALIRIWSPWLAPRHGKNIFSVAEDAVMCSFLRHDGLHLVLLAVSGIDDVLTVFKNDGKGQVIVSSRNDSPDSGQARVLAAVGRTFEKANAACMYHARKLVSGKVSISKDVHNELAKPIDEDMRAQYMENWYDGLTYCTWNGLGQDLNEQKIFDALDDLKQNNIKVTNLIIDDNWQSLDNQGESQFRRGWTDFEANKEGFPRGLRHTVATLRDNHPNIQHVAVWHALLGYWGGVSPTGNIAKKYKTKLVERNSGLPSFISAGNITVIDPDDVQKMYDDFYKFLLDSRVDSVKTDAQFFLDLLSDAEDRRRFTKAYQDAWTISSLRYFSVKSISCMSQTPPIIFHTQLPMDKPHQMVRNSDDFFPEVPTSHPWHVFTNAYNALLNSHLNILPDWDMFQTSHEYSSFHAAGRCISGGPIYFTDEPGKHDIDLINQMTAISVKDKTVILRPDNIGKTISSEVYTAYEDERMLKVGNYHGRKASGTGILAIFNVSLRPLSELVMLGEFPGVEEDVEYIVRAHSTGEVSPPMKKTDKLAIVSLELQTKGWDIISAYPLQSFTSKGTLTKVTNLGLLGKMTGAAAITSLDAHMEGDIRFRMRSSLKALGLLGIYISDLRNRTIEDNFLITILGRTIPIHTVAKSQISDCVLEVDIERAWNEMKLDSGYNNEVAVDIIMT